MKLFINIIVDRTIFSSESSEENCLEIVVGFVMGNLTGPTIVLSI